MPSTPRQINPRAFFLRSPAPRQTPACSSILALVVLWSLCAAGCEDPVRTTLLAAREATFAERYGQAAKIYDGVLDQLDLSDSLERGLHREVLMELGRLHRLYLGRPQEAVTFYRRVTEEAPRSEAAFAAQLAIAEMTEYPLEDVEQAISEYQRLIAEFPDRAELGRYQLRVSELYLKLRDYDQARTEASIFLRRFPDSALVARVRMVVAASFSLERRRDEALAEYHAIVAEFPGTEVAALARVELANQHQRAGEDQLALDQLYAALERHPNPKLVQMKIQHVRERLAASKASEGILRGY